MKIGICDDDKEIREMLQDIQMQGKSGIETVKELRLTDRHFIIFFVTAIEDYILQAFDVDAFHYFVKPF